MKVKIVFSVICILFSIYACNNHYKKEYEIIEKCKSLANTFPDSANYLIRTIKDPVKPGYDFYMAYTLLSVQIKDKLKQKIATDTNIVLAVDYYIEKKNQANAALASFYAGKMYLEQGKTKEAMYHMLESKRYAGQTNNSPLLGLSCYYIGKLYKSEILYEPAFDHFKWSASCFQQYNDTSNYAFAIYEIADCLRIQDKFDQALQYYNRLLGIRNIDLLIPSLYTHIGGVYLEMHNLKHAKVFLLQAIQQDDRQEQNSHNLLILSDVYRDLGNTDSANYYLRQSEVNIKHSNNLLLKAKYFLQRAEINESNDDFPAALQDYKTYLTYYDSLTILKDRKSILEITQKYNAERLDNDYHRQIIYKQYLAFAGFVIIFICIIIIFNYKRKNNRIKTRLLETELTMTSLTHNMDKYDAMQQKMKDLIFEKMAISKRVALLNYMGSIDEKSMKKINEIIYGECSSNNFDWEMLYQLLNDLYDHFVEKIKKQCTLLSESEIQFCCLLKAKYTTGEIAFVMNLQIDSVRMKKMKIRKIFGLRNREDIIEFLDRVIETSGSVI